MYLNRLCKGQTSKGIGQENRKGGEILEKIYEYEKYCGKKKGINKFSPGRFATHKNI